jgi:NAD(P)-dependent dehydrogenase (short-subunit alcohol dehydrogenase family)
MRPLLLISGMGDGLGTAMAETFAATGHDVIGLARTDKIAAIVATRVATQGGAYAHIVCDVTRPDDVARALRPYLDRVSVLIHNAHALLIKPFLEIDPAAFEQAWRVTCFSGLLVARAVLPGMAERGKGTIIFSGATASWRGGPKFSAFASAKFALRGLAQAMAREYGSLGIHVAHVVIDGLIEGEKTDQRFGPAKTSRMAPDAVARAYLYLANQPASAWSHELDLRPFSEGGG